MIERWWPAVLSLMCVCLFLLLLLLLMLLFLLLFFFFFFFSLSPFFSFSLWRVLRNEFQESNRTFCETIRPFNQHRKERVSVSRG